MSNEICLDEIYVPSEDVVVREIEGELFIVPIAAGVGDIDDALFTLNETGRAIWNRLDGTRSLREVAADLAAEFAANTDQIEADILGLVEELTVRKMLIRVC